MIDRLAHGKIIWVSLKNPTPEEVRQVMDELDLPPLLMEDLTTPTPKNYVRRSEDAVKIVLDFPVVKHIKAGHAYEVKFIVSKKCLLTVQYEEMGGMDRFRRQAEVAATLRRTQKNLTGATLFVSLMNHLYESTSLKLDYIETKLSDIENDIFKNNEKEMVFEISNISKILISFKHNLVSHKEILEDAFPHLESIFKAHYTHEFETIQNQYQTLVLKTNGLFETLMALRDTNTAMLFTKQNEVMKIFTIMAFTTYPLTLMSSLFGMNTIHSPIVGMQGDFWIIVAIMLVIMFCFFAFFKHKGWM